MSADEIELDDGGIIGVVDRVHLVAQVREGGARAAKYWRTSISPSNTCPVGTSS